MLHYALSYRIFASRFEQREEIMVLYLETRQRQRHVPVYVPPTQAAKQIMFDSDWQSVDLSQSEHRVRYELVRKAQSLSHPSPKDTIRYYSIRSDPIRCVALRWDPKIKYSTTQHNTTQ
mmetsp:Transcript_30117/g.71021  ORF Transcript_30117/g.71021 Transcript_30117/m.71021 type:complete len:119 (-) Transcript_30117:340-696(-)